MLKALRSLACGLLLVSSGASSEPQSQPGNMLAPVGPIGYWKGDDGEAPKTAVDATGNGFNGSYSVGATTSTTDAGIKFPNPGCIKLDGVAGVITVPDSPVLRLTGDMTISFWKRKTGIAKDWTRMVGKGNGAQRNFGVWESPDGEGRILFQQYGPGGQPVIDLFSPGVTEINKWYHILCAVSVNSVAMYFNGALVGNGTRNGEPGTSADPLTFGFAGFHTFWPGQLDDIRLYNRALSMSEIVYLAGGNGPPAPPTDLAAAGATLKWAASKTVPPAGTATYYLVKRSATQGKDYAVIGSLLTGTTYTDLKADAGKTYFYLVTAVNTGGESVASNEVSVGMPAK
ncbi:MAG: hypothetical protein HY293_03380 [Planctomycetes bacterium]|nr:hypothetical protein [Planctomycetota bacterium]